MKECRYRIGSDKRKVSLRFVVDLLVNRLNEVVQYITDSGLSPPPMLDENEVALKSALDTLGLGHITKALECIGTKDRPLPDTGVPGDPLSLLNRADTTATKIDLTELDANMGLLVEPSIFDDSAQLLHSDIIQDLDLEASVDISSQPLHEDEILDVGDRPESVHGIPLDTGLNDSFTESRHQQQNNHFSQKLAPRQEYKHDHDNQVIVHDSQESLKSSDDMEDIVHRLSDRMGSLQIGSDGQVRYYGPTSHFNLLRMPTPDNLTVHRTIRKDGEDYLYRLGLGKSVPEELEEHLLNLYFTWHNPLFDVVDRGMYNVAKQKWHDHMEETPYYSEALTNAMCCLGAAFEPRYHPNFITYPKSLSDFFADRAKTLLDIELDSPCLATVQAMVVLSGHDIGCKRDARGWLYSGMAMRLAFDLGLHIDMSTYVAKGSISTDEAELRRMVFWGAYTLDHHWGFLLGRPFRINMEDVTVDKPRNDADSNNSHDWISYGLPYPITSTNSIHITSPIMTLSRYRITLCEIMTPLGHVLYGSSKISKHALQKLNEETTGKLLQWKLDLPAILQVDLDDHVTPVLPHVLLLHMHYHQSIIHAHRPWMSKHSIQPQPAQGPGYGHAREMCIESAIAIAKLLRLYEIRYTFRRMNVQAVAITCSAALILIFATILKQQFGCADEIAAHLNACFRALEEFGLSWESAKRAQAFLLRMQGLWETRFRAYRATKRTVPGSLGEFQPSSPGSKRSRIGNRPMSLETDDSVDEVGPQVQIEKQGTHGIESEAEEIDWLLTTSIDTIPS
ncbi:fungal-specific transcription factor domain-containing protein [Penicillium macrosclerotiorum]|uniref:fungal-specific transcription factor domain-containing protein n=1 Tax=Penicillium macrosclerotiorum TaxID=303699 RepID=UPI002547873F|nr:fungal-specific transcription factor domain-containing protein [Penicillium macrosclerotiorum]KAJ5679445.1 fungal-specific transcription factor domain-containing protein [Penicillium macrosclerotiorum]